MSSEEPRDQAASWSKRLRAREQGEIPVSRDFTSVLALVGGLGLLALVSGQCWTGLQATALESWRWTGAATLRIDSQEDLNTIAGGLGGPLALLAVGIFLIAFSTGWLQMGCGMFWNRLLPDLGRLNPARNWQESYSVGRWTNALVGMLRWLVLWAVVLFSLWSSRDSFVRIHSSESIGWLTGSATVVFGVLLKVVAAIGVMSCLDYALQRWWHERRLRMSPNEVREELRASQIDPFVTQHRKVTGRGFVQNGIIRAVRKADIVLTDGTGATIGLAMSEDPHDDPKMVLRAGLAQADAIQQLAAQFQIPVLTHSVASRLFARCRLESSLPPDLVLTVRSLLTARDSI